MAEITVREVPEGSVVLLQGVMPPNLDPDQATEWVDYVGNSVARVAGHARFVLLTTPTDDPARFEVWSLDDDLEAKVRALLSKEGD